MRDDQPGRNLPALDTPVVLVMVDPAFAVSTDYLANPGRYHAGFFQAGIGSGVADLQIIRADPVVVHGTMVRVRERLPCSVDLGDRTVVVQ